MIDTIRWKSQVGVRPVHAGPITGFPTSQLKFARISEHTEATPYCSMMGSEERMLQPSSCWRLKCPYSGPDKKWVEKLLHSLVWAGSSVGRASGLNSGKWVPLIFLKTYRRSEVQILSCPLRFK